MTRRPEWVLIAVGLLVVLGGCSALSPSTDEPTTRTITPVPVPSDTDAAAGTPVAAEPTVRSGLDSFAGVSAGHGIDVERLLAAHVVYLSTHSYTVEWARWTAGGTESVANRFQRRVEVADDETYLRRNRGISYGNVTSTYVGPEGAYRRVVGDDATDVTPVTVRDDDAARERFAHLVAFEVRAFLGNGYDELDVVERDGRRYARVFVTRPPPQLAQIYDAYALRNFSATLWVAPEGYVQAVHYEFDLVGAEYSFAVEWRYAYTAVGETTVDRPPWVPTGGTAGASSNATATDAAPTGTQTPDPSRVPPPTAPNATAADPGGL
ncbi:DUF7537 family lipoprotein [Halosimplex amylolyticum]|uniref:DUF7537 family lipoprotein n=1 Tax=Halosimplex amylolyticum TaxID=3396616 RepID=UPI003F547763